MERGTIKLEKGEFILSDIPIWMTVEEMSDLFMISSYEIRKTLKAIYRNKMMIKADAIKLFRFTGYYVEAYNMETIVILSFCINVPICRKFRKFILRKLQEKRIAFLYWHIYNMLSISN